MKRLLFIAYTATTLATYAQPKLFTRSAQFSLTPGVSTNGMNHEGFTNYFSFNLTSGASYANFALEVGGISNQNSKETRGVQIAGLVNSTGTNAFVRMLPKEIDRLKREGFEANLSGAQFSGVANIVLNNVFGWQATGGVNISKGALFGFQLAGISNTVSRYSFGVQIAGLYNVSAESMDGVQLSGLFNVTTGGLFGVQIAAVNRAGFIQGKNSLGSTDPSGLQLGVVNYADRMNGFQIGLVNISKSMQGTQIGLINIYRGGTQGLTRDGTSIGLINIGSSVAFRLSTNEIFFSNVEISTGTFKNRRIKSDRMNKFVQNALMYSWTPRFAGDRSQWAFGYGLRKVFLIRSPLQEMNHFWFVSYGIDWMHVNPERGKVFHQLSLLTRPHVTIGSRIHQRNHVAFVFASLAYNYYVTDSTYGIETMYRPGKKHWPGFSLGFMIH